MGLGWGILRFHFGGEMRSVLISMVLLAGCKASNSTDVVCTLEARAGINVTVRDAETQAGLAGIARGAAIDGAYVDSLRPGGSTSTLSGAYERVGTYTVEIRATGYEGYTTTNVRVFKDACHVIPQQLTVSLQKAKS